MKQQRVILTPAPGAVFLRTGSETVEMEPGEAVRVARELMECARIALAVRDGAAVLGMMGRPRAS